MRRAIFSILLLVGAAACAAGEDKPFLGVRFGEGAQIEHLFAGAPAEKAGLKVGDRIIAAAANSDGEKRADAQETDNTKSDTTKIDSTEAMQLFLSERRIGDVLELTVLRDEESVTVSPKLVKHTVKFYLKQKDPPRIPGGIVKLGGGTIDSDYRTSGNTVITGPSTITRGLTQTWTGILDLRVTKPGDPPPLSVGGAVALAGLLYVHIDGDPPKLSDRYELIGGATAITGEFDVLMLPPLEKNLAWRVEYDNIEKMRDLDGDKQHDVTLVVIDARMPVVEK